MPIPYTIQYHYFILLFVLYVLKVLLYCYCRQLQYGAVRAGVGNELYKLVSTPLSPLGGIGTRHGGSKFEWTIRIQKAWMHVLVATLCTET